MLLKELPFSELDPFPWLVRAFHNVRARRWVISCVFYITLKKLHLFWNSSWIFLILFTISNIYNYFFAKQSNCYAVLIHYHADMQTILKEYSTLILPNQICFHIKSWNSSLSVFQGCPQVYYTINSSQVWRRWDVWWLHLDSVSQSPSPI